MAGILQVNYDEMDAASRQIQTLSADAQRLIESYNGEIQKLTAFFTGVADDEMLNQHQSCMAKLKFTPEMLQQMGAAIATASAKLREGEESAKAAISSTVTADGQ
jgi:WXG100 family type VII secretion target